MDAMTVFLGVVGLYLVHRLVFIPIKNKSEEQYKNKPQTMDHTMAQAESSGVTAAGPYVVT